jgi:hypothetical protein
MKHKQRVAARPEAAMLPGNHPSVRRKQPNPINPRRPHPADAPRILPHPSQSIRALLRRREVKVRQLADRVPERIVDLPERTVAAMHVSKGNVRQVRRRRRRERFDAVPGNENDIASKLRKRRRQTRHCGTGLTGVVIGGILTRVPRDFGVNLPPSLPDGVHRAPMGRVEVHPGADDLEAEARVPAHRLERGAHEAELGARAGHEADSPFCRSLTRHG